MAQGNRSIFTRILWSSAIVSIVLAGCGTKESAQLPTSAPMAAVETSIEIPLPSDTSTAAPPSETPSVLTLTPSTEQPPLASTATDTPQAVVTDTPSPAQSAMPLMQWTTWGWVSSNSPMACQDASSPCWMLTNYKELSSLICAETVFVNGAWQSPALVFQTRYAVKENKAFGFVEIQVQGEATWNRVYTLKGSRDYWHEVAIDLSPFSGKAIIIRFATKPFFNIIQGVEATKTVYNKETWIIQNMVIEPNKIAD